MMDLKIGQPISVPANNVIGKIERTARAVDELIIRINDRWYLASGAK